VRPGEDEDEVVKDSTPRDGPRPKGRWTSFVADPADDPPRVLHEQNNPVHRLRVEHNRETLLIHLSGEDGRGWTVIAVDRDSRRWAVSQGATQLSTAERAYQELNGPG
jgi:hypothetical protein